ncbi:hypothetical protein CesoFtcFv8_019878 [Champsocephalus esox]|uniref:Uncharacterized protein n=1 Tax=Champsocephalus esox TaxID=159716 RepID=A0AAN8BEY0_9TELE|nr:hypothetical protein CesoFtcFv8_019878 [Champsocephalus esox]
MLDPTERSSAGCQRRYHPDQWRLGSERNDDGWSHGKCFSYQHCFIPVTNTTANPSLTPHRGLRLVKAQPISSHQ